MRCWLALLLVLVTSPAWSATYYVQDGGAGTKAESVNIATPMSVSTFNGNTYAAGDIVYFMGTFDLSTSTITIPSSGTGWGAGEFITYSSYAATPAILDGGAKDWVTNGSLIHCNSKDYVKLLGFTFKNITSSGAAAGNALDVTHAIMQGEDLIFTDWVPGSTGGAWVESGGTGVQDFTNCSFSAVDDEMISCHTSGVYSLSFTNCSFTQTGAKSGLSIQLVYAPTSLIYTGCTFDGSANTTTSMFQVASLATGSPLLLEKCTFIDSYIEIAGAVINYSIFKSTKDRATLGFITLSATVNNCVFFNADPTLSVFQHYDDADPRDNAVFVLNNSIVYDARVVMHWVGAATGGSCTVSNSVLYSINANEIAVEGNTTTVADSLTDDPQFVSPGVDYHLLPTSPAIYAGKDVSLTYDFDGKPIRGATPNIGAYESWPGIF